MAKIARLNDDYLVNFDDHFLYSGEEKIVELRPKALALLEYLSETPNCYKSCDNIIDNLYEEVGSDSTIRNLVCNLRGYHPIIREMVIGKKGAGYKYIGNKIETYSLGKKQTKFKETVDRLASKLWVSRPFYQDDALISTLYYRNNFNDTTGYDETITFMTIKLLEQSYSGGSSISPNELPEDSSNQLIVIKDSFLLEDIFYEGKHLSDFNTPFDMLDINEEKITMIFVGQNSPVKTSMWLSGAKACMPLRHLIKILFESDRIFRFQVWGYFDKLSSAKYSIKPLSVVYI